MQILLHEMGMSPWRNTHQLRPDAQRQVQQERVGSIDQGHMQNGPAMSTRQSTNNCCATNRRTDALQLRLNKSLICNLMVSQEGLKERMLTGERRGGNMRGSCLLSSCGLGTGLLGRSEVQSQGWRSMSADQHSSGVRNISFSLHFTQTFGRES